MADTRDPALIDSPAIRSSGPEVLSLALMDARNHTLHVYRQFENQHAKNAGRLVAMATVDSPLWTLGHVGWFQEWWTSRNLQRALGSRCPPDPMRLPSAAPEADSCWGFGAAWPAERWNAPLPDADRCRAFLLETLESTLELLDKAGDSGKGDGDGEGHGDGDTLYFYRLALLHEDLRGEALLQAAQALGVALDLPLLAALQPPAMAARETVGVPATRWQMGSPAGPGFALDNEQPVHRVDVPEFEIDAQPVSWAQFVEFVADGGYDRPDCWQPAGWQWLQAAATAEGRRGPRYVEQIGRSSGAVIQTRFGQPVRMQALQPAMHLTWWEADAWCRWAGRRLPAEVEWEIAAETASRRGFRWGSVWEWVGTTFQPYPGFMPGPCQDWSVPAFGSHKVLRGGSFASRARLKHPRFRQFALPENDLGFCGFRSCAL